MTPPRISIVTPVFNSEAFIEEAITSVLDQNYPNLQYFIIDGGSTDNTVNLIRKYDKHLSGWISEPDSGQSDAIAKGFALCNGEIFNWLNADDSYRPLALSHVGEAFTDPSINVFAARSYVYGLGKGFVSNGTDIYPESLERTIGRARIDQPETFFRRSVISTVGGINPSLHYLMDLELWIRYLLCYGLKGIVQSDNMLVNFRLHETSKTVSQQDGFVREGNMLASAILDSASPPQLRQLVDIMTANPYNTDLEKVKREFALLRYSIS